MCLCMDIIHICCQVDDFLKVVSLLRQAGLGTPSRSCGGAGVHWDVPEIFSISLFIKMMKNITGIYTYIHMIYGYRYIDICYIC